MSEAHRKAKNFITSLLKLIEQSNQEEPNDFLPPKPAKDYSSDTLHFLLSSLLESISKLLHFKSSIEQSDLYELAIDTEKFEKLIQLNEKLVREKIKSQNELRVQIQDQKWKIDQLESQGETVEKMKKKLEEQLVVLKIPKKFDENKVKLEMTKKIEEMKTGIEKTEDRIKGLAADNLDLAGKLKEKEKELKILKREKRRIEGVAHSMIASPKNVDLEELQPNYECSIFLNPLLEKEAARAKFSFDCRFLSSSFVGNREHVRRPKRFLTHSQSHDSVKEARGSVIY